MFLQCIQAEQFGEPGKAYRNSLEQKGRNACSLGALACENKGLSILLCFSFQLCMCLSFCLFTAVCCHCTGASFMYRLLMTSSQIEHSWVLDVSSFQRDSRVFQVELVQFIFLQIVLLLFLRVFCCFGSSEDFQAEANIVKVISHAGKEFWKTSLLVTSRRIHS